MKLLSLSPLTLLQSPLTLFSDDMSATTNQYRALLWLFAGVGLLCFWPAFQGATGGLPISVGLMSAGVGLLCLFTGAWFGWKGAQLRIAERERKAEAIALVTLAAFLKEKSEVELQGVIAKGGPAAAAAALILKRRTQQR